MNEVDPEVRVEFLPPNTTSLIQPLDQEVIAVVKAAYLKRQFRNMREASKDEKVIQGLIEDEDDEDEDEAQAATESEARVMRYWKNFKVKEAVHLMVSCWNDVTQATVRHAWRNILEGLPEDRRVPVVGEHQSVEAELTGVVNEARTVSGAGFAVITQEDIMHDKVQPPALTAQDMLEEDEEDVDGIREPSGLSFDEIKEMLQIGARLRHLLEQDSTTNNELHCVNISQVLGAYEDKYRAHCNEF